MPGQRDRHTGCVGAYLVEHDLFDFLLFSLPDNDTHSHKVGPDGQVRSIAEADRALERIMHVAGGADAFLEDHAVIVMSDHSQTAGRATSVNLAEAFADWRVLTPVRPGARSRRSWPSARARARRWSTCSTRGAATSWCPAWWTTLASVDGVDLVIAREDGEAVVRSRARRAALRPGRRAWPTCAGGAGASTGDAGRARPRPSATAR